VRLIAATNRDLRAEFWLEDSAKICTIASATIQIRVPGLIETPWKTFALVQFFLKKLSRL